MQSNIAFVRSEKTKPPRTATKPQYTGKQWKRTDNKRNTPND